MKVRGWIPDRPVELAELMAEWPTVRQSVLASFDSCALSAWFALRHGRDWHTHEQARGIIGHEALAEILRTMREHGNDVIGPEEALQILYEVAAQRDTPADERVRVTVEELDFLRMAVAKFASDNKISVSKLLAVEESFDATVRYPRPEGGQVERVVTARPDAVIIRSADTLRVIDWKFSWRPPTERRGEGYKPDDLAANDTLTPEGYFQQRAHGLVLFQRFPAVRVIEHREFYPARTEARTARLERDRDLPRLEQAFALLVEQFDRAMMSGPPAHGAHGVSDRDGNVEHVSEAELLGDWLPTPGYHCRHCPKPGACPIDPELRPASEITDEAMAVEFAARRERVQALFKHLTAASKAWCEEHGPIPVKDPKGDRVLGWHEGTKSRRFETFIPGGGA